ncbi:MAG: pyridoxal phosphate-dependent aminotransferase [Kofleriaceae bacterium]|nr:pyridoxal phosphate-dependent aminotransferase [Kofleriaceae bacterium]
MSRFPGLSNAGENVPASIFAKLREHLARFPGDVIPLQIGDTHLHPPATLEAVAWAELTLGDVYSYGTPAGWAPLVAAIVEKARTKNRLSIGEANVQVACGATHALSAAVQALCDRGEELILVTPHWPLIKGMAIGHGAVPVEVPFAPDLEPVLEAAITPRTAAIYVATPNNPDGVMLTAAQLDGLARVAERHSLWILADEVYEDYGYDAEHVSIATHPLAAPRTVTVFSFAKSYAQAGLRVGYALAPEPVAAAMKKLVNHSVYNVPVAMQRAALGAMHAGAPFLQAARERYRGARDRARARLVAPAACPPGGAYLWVDFSRWSPGDCMPVLERVAEKGVLLAPGSAFGDACHAYARLCFTGVAEPRLDEGIDRINAVLADW